MNQRGTMSQLGTMSQVSSASRMARQASPTRPPARQLHLTRRGRGVVVLALLALLLAGLSLRQAHSDASTTGQSSPAVPVATQTIVRQGDTLWSVARRIAPDRDAREVVAQLRKLNALRGATLLVGQQLLLPR